jgi:hypothetical protein
MPNDLPEKSAKMPKEISAKRFTTYEMRAREAKARKVAALLKRAGITVAEAQAASDNDWQLAANGAEVQPLSSMTRDLVISYLKELETTAND